MQIVHNLFPRIFMLGCRDSVFKFTFFSLLVETFEWQIMTYVSSGLCSLWYIFLFFLLFKIQSWVWCLESCLQSNEIHRLHCWNHSRVRLNVWPPHVKNNVTISINNHTEIEENRIQTLMLILSATPRLSTSYANITYDHRLNVSSQFRV